MNDIPYSVVFAGTPACAVPSLKALNDDPAFDVQLVITQPDKPIGRKRELTPSPVKIFAQQHNLNIAQPNNINHYQLSTINYQLLVVVAYGQLLSQNILDVPSIAPINVHFSLLPRWRGAAPVQHALLNGDTKTGITIQHMKLQLDAGPILAQQERILDGTETAPTLYEELGQQGAKLLIDTLKKPFDPKPQDESQKTHGRKITKEMGSIDHTTMTAVAVDRSVRALVPWPGVRTTINGRAVKLIEISPTETDGSLALQCKDTVLYVTKLQPPGKTVMSALAWQRGLK